MNYRMDLSLGQKQVQKLSPRMIHSMEVLQLPQIALTERIEKELQENPFLETHEHLGHEKNGTLKNGAHEAAGEIFNPNKPLEFDKDNQLDFQRLEALDKQLGGIFDEENRPSRAARQEMSDKKLEAINNMPGRGPSLQEHLAEQMALLTLTEEARERVEHLVQNLNDKGYLAAPLEEIALTFGKPATPDEWEEALEVLQELEPAGIGARDAKECLYLQIDENTPHGDLLRVVIRNHLEDLSHNRLPIIQKATGCSMETLKDAIQMLRSLNPWPAGDFEVSKNHYVSPDVIVERNDKGDYDIKLTDDRTPKIFLNRRYLEMYRNGAGTEKEKEYMRKNLQSAQLLLSSIDQRRSTLEKVARAVVDHQKGFFDKGVDFIEPLKMEQIAEQVKVHVTTISRAVNDKWVQTPRGIFPLKRFFLSGTHNDLTGENIAWERIKSKIQAIVANEDKNNPLSDDEIAKLMIAEGFSVARRTVTKYRKQMKIPSSRERKQWG